MARYVSSGTTGLECNDLNMNQILSSGWDRRADVEKKFFKFKKICRGANRMFRTRNRTDINTAFSWDVSGSEKAKSRDARLANLYHSYID